MEKMLRENARQIKKHWGTLDNCIEVLLEYQKNNESVVTEFNGHKLYSCDITVDRAYKEILGYTKTEQEILKNEESLMKLIISQCNETTAQNIVISPSGNVLHHFQLPSGLQVYSESKATFDMQAPKKLSMRKNSANICNKCKSSSLR